MTDTSIKHFILKNGGLDFTQPLLQQQQHQQQQQKNKNTIHYGIWNDLEKCIAATTTSRINPTRVWNPLPANVHKKGFTSSKCNLITILQSIHYLGHRL